MKSAIAVRHVHFEDLGVLEPFLRERGYEVRYLDAGVDDLAGVDPASPDLVVVLGAPIGAGDEEIYPFLADELALVRDRLDVRRPLLGICLGAQLIARVLGAEVKPMGVKEIGFSSLTLTEQGKASPLAALGTAPVLHWHGDQFGIPPGATRLAYTDVCANQAFAMGRAVLGLQFHLEADPVKIERWLLGHACELGQAGVDPREIRRQAREFGPALSAAASEVIGEWLD
jgi:GMP synthase (glutamine-hydrolysing)